MTVKDERAKYKATAETRVMLPEDARYLVLAGRVRIVGHGKVNVGDTVIAVALVVGVIR